MPATPSPRDSGIGKFPEWSLDALEGRDNDALQRAEIAEEAIKLLAIRICTKCEIRRLCFEERDYPEICEAYHYALADVMLQEDKWTIADLKSS
jgi:hypothetical protein